MSCRMQAAHSSSRSAAPQLVQAGGGEAVEHRERERRDVVDVLVVRLEAVGEVLDRLLADVLKSARWPSRRSKKMPSRRPASVTSTASKPPCVECRGEHERPAEYHVATIGLDAR